MHSSHSCPLLNRKTIQLGKHLNLEKKCIVIKLENHAAWKTFESEKNALLNLEKKREKFSLKNI